MTTNVGDRKWQVEPWNVEEAGVVAKTAIFDLKKRRCTSPESGKHGEYVYLDSSSWVNVLALTERNEVVMIEQFRHGLATITLEVPGGIIDPGESPEQAGLRELREETGYAGDEAQLIGSVSTNPAIMNNWCSTVIVKPADQRGEVELDPSEEIAVRLVPLDRVDDLIRAGIIHHAMVVAAFHHLRLM